MMNLSKMSGFFLLPYAGEMNVNIDCERIVPARNKRFTCTCQEVEEQILQMAKGMYPPSYIVFLFNICMGARWPAWG